METKTQNQTTQGSIIWEDCANLTTFVVYNTQFNMSLYRYFSQMTLILIYFTINPIQLVALIQSEKHASNRGKMAE